MHTFRRVACRLAELSAAAFGCLLLAAPAIAQCQMCREAAASQNQEAITALQNGILILGAPPLAIAGGIIWLTYRNRNQFAETGRKEDSSGE